MVKYAETIHEVDKKTYKNLFAPWHMLHTPGELVTLSFGYFRLPF